ncbi:HEAT repeat domain-containing protein, partial [Candidatus Halobeggiatoa sp. HSG11]|nr:HEAT repeat domain-containing protein [Candidatus Halobeggiatoa sp. HSG11]
MIKIKPEDTQAILIGASKFDFGKDAGFQDLPSVNTNLSKLNLLLIDVVGIDKENIRTLQDMDNSNVITSEIIDIVPKATDTVIVYYAGHGIRHQQKLYLATKKTDFKEPEYTGAVGANHLVNLVIRKSKANNIIFIIDCCFSAMAKEGVDSRGKNVFFITAASSTQTAKDESPVDTNYTAFSRELLVILENGIDWAGEFLTVQDISNRLYQQLKWQNMPEPQSGSHGLPDKLGICKNKAYQNNEPNEQEIHKDVDKPLEIITTPSLIQTEINDYLDDILLDVDELEKRYIDLSATTEFKQLAPVTKGNIIPPEFQIIKQQFHPVQEESKSLDAISEALELHDCFMLLGAPGAGKSTTLKKLQLDSALLAKQDSANRIPIFINLALWHDDIVDLQEFLNNQFHKLPYIPLHKRLILLDGLNEMPSKKYVQRIKMFASWLQDNSELSVIIGCRERHYQQSKKLELPTVQIAPFDAKRIQRFLQVYLGSEEATQLLNQLGSLEPQQRSARDLIYLADNPYLLSMICFVYEANNKQLPSSRGRLFQLFVQVLYKRENDKGTTKGISYEDFVLGLSEMAFAMQNHRSSTSVHTAWATKQIPEQFSVDLLWNLGREASLLSFLKGEQVVQFTHQLILEYLAAEGLLKRLANLFRYIKKPGFHRNQRGSGAWDEVVYTLVGISDANKLLVKLAEIDPFLAVDCFEHVPQEVELTDETRNFVTGRIIDCLSAKNPQAREAAVLKVKQLGNVTLSYLIDLLDNGSKVAKRACLKALSQFDEPLAFKAVILALENSNKWVRKDAGEILDRIELSKFESLIQGQDKNIIAILEKYGYVGLFELLPKKNNDNNIDKLIPYLENKSPSIRISTINELGKLGSTEVIDKIIPYLEDENYEVRISTIKALAQLDSKEAIDKIIPFLEDENPNVRAHTINALAQLDAKEAIDKIIPFLEDENPNVRAHTINALVQLGDKEVIDKIIPFLEDTHPTVRSSTINALVQLGDKEVIDKI